MGNVPYVRPIVDRRELDTKQFSDFFWFEEFLHRDYALDSARLSD